MVNTSLSHNLSVETRADLMPDPIQDPIRALFFSYSGHASIKEMSQGLRHGYHVGAFLYQELDTFPGQLGKMLLEFYFQGRKIL